MRIAPWNLERCSARSHSRLPRIQEAMHAISADIWILTETHLDVTPGIGYELVSHSAPAPDRNASSRECWVAIWSRIAGTPTPLSAEPERSAALSVAGIAIVGTVLPWLTDARFGAPGSARFAQSLALQSQEWVGLADALCVAGDFNQDLLPSGHYYGSAEGRRALQETLTTTDLRCITGGSDDLLAEAGTACIDHICTRGLTASDKGVWPAPGSLDKKVTDHYGFWADLRLA